MGKHAACVCDLACAMHIFRVINAQKLFEFDVGMKFYSIWKLRANLPFEKHVKFHVYFPKCVPEKKCSDGKHWVKENKPKQINSHTPKESTRYANQFIHMLQQNKQSVAVASLLQLVVGAIYLLYCINAMHFDCVFYMWVLLNRCICTALNSIASKMVLNNGTNCFQCIHFGCIKICGCFYMEFLCCYCHSHSDDAELSWISRQNQIIVANDTASYNWQYSGAEYMKWIWYHAGYFRFSAFISWLIELYYTLSK